MILFTDLKYIKYATYNPLLLICRQISEYLGMFMNCLQIASTVHQLLPSNQKLNADFVWLPCFIFWNNINSTRSLWVITQHKFSGNNITYVTPTSQVHMVTIIDGKKLTSTEVGGGGAAHNIYAKFHQNLSVGFRVIMVELGYYIISLFLLIKLIYKILQ